MINLEDRQINLNELLGHFGLLKEGVKDSALKNDEKLFSVKQLNNLIIVVESMKKAQV